MASFYDITVFFSANTKLIERGENHLKSSHLQSFMYDPENEDIQGKVQASLRDTIYSVSVCRSKYMHTLQYVEVVYVYF